MMRSLFSPTGGIGMTFRRQPKPRAMAVGGAAVAQLVCPAPQSQLSPSGAPTIVNPDRGRVPVVTEMSRDRPSVIVGSLWLGHDYRLW